MANTSFSTIDLNKAAADVNHALKEGAYIAVGLGVLGFQRAQVRRVELAKQLEAQRAELAKQLESQRQQFSRLPETLSAQFENYSQTARSQGDVARAQVTDQLNILSKNLEDTIGPAVQRLARLAQTDAPELPDFGEQFKDTTQVLEDRLETVRAQLTELARASTSGCSRLAGNWTSSWTASRSGCRPAPATWCSRCAPPAPPRSRRFRSTIGLD